MTDDIKIQNFSSIKESIMPSIEISKENFILAGGDSLKILKKIPSHTVSLILTDPPYHSTKKHNIFGDRSFEEDEHYLEWLSDYAKEWHRILKPNGSLLCFCASEMESRLEERFRRNFNILSRIVWTKPNDPGFDGWKQKMRKEALRQWYPHSERIIFAEPAYEGNIFRSYFGILLHGMRIKTGLSMHQLTEAIGEYGKVNHGGAVSNWEAGRNTPTKQQYEKIVKALLETGKIKEIPHYEDVIRPFRVEVANGFTDIWTFPSVKPYKGKHPAEKPIQMLEYVIGSTTYPGDIVLDCFAGSGNTAVAAIKLGRRAVALEIEPKWVRGTASKLKETVSRRITEYL